MVWERNQENKCECIFDHLQRKIDICGETCTHILTRCTYLISKCEPLFFNSFSQTIKSCPYGLMKLNWNKLKFRENLKQLKPQFFDEVFLILKLGECSCKRAIHMNGTKNLMSPIIILPSILPIHFFTY